MDAPSLSAANICPIAPSVLSDSIQIKRNRYAVPHADMCEAAVNCLSFREPGEYLWTYIFF